MQTWCNFPDISYLIETQKILFHFLKKPHSVQAFMKSIIFCVYNKIKNTQLCLTFIYPFIFEYCKFGNFREGFIFAKLRISRSFVKIRSSRYGEITFSFTDLIDGWLRMGLLPPLGNFADISYLVENWKPSLLRDVCTLCSGALVCKSL